MSGFVLRIIAMLTMLTDHIGWSFLKDPMKLTWIGRIAFPVYALLLAEGFHIIHNDRDRLRNHLSILLILAIVSELGYDLMEAGVDFAHYLNSQSNMITLLLGYTGMLATEMFAPAVQSSRKQVLGMRFIPLFCAYGLLGFANYMMRANFNIVGPWLVIAFYWYLRLSRGAGKNGYTWSWGKRFLVLLAGFTVYLAMYFWVRSGFGNAARWWQEVVNYAPWIIGHMIAALIISLYNGRLGYSSKWFRILYLSFYPAHLYVIGIIGLLRGKS